MDALGELAKPQQLASSYLDGHAPSMSRASDSARWTKRIWSASIANVTRAHLFALCEPGHNR
jgi:hypothetical protein